jgi:hypothetical protein
MQHFRIILCVVFGLTLIQTAAAQFHGPRALTVNQTNSVLDAVAALNLISGIKLGTSIFSRYY